MAHKLNLFPRIYRTITEEWKTLLVSFIAGIILIAIMLEGISLYHNLQEEKKMNIDREKAAQELNFWKSKLAEYPNYRDLYFKIANLEYKLGRNEEAKKYLNKTLELDPNFQKGREMEKQLGL